MTSRFAASTSVLAAALAVSAVRADFFQYTGAFANGYSVQGIIETKASAPVSFVESNPSFPSAPFATQYVQNASLSVSLLGSVIGAAPAVAGGVAYDPYLYVALNSSTLSLSAIDLNTRGLGTGPEPYYFISNGVAPDASVVAYGSTTYNLFRFDPVTNGYTFLASTVSLQVTAIPAPGALAALALAGFVRQRRR
jgi:hypothetical protein